MCMASWSKLTVVNESYAPKHYFSDAKWKMKHQSRTFYWFYTSCWASSDASVIVNMMVSYLSCVLFYVHETLFYWVLRLGWVPVLMFLQLIDVYFDCKSRNECWEKDGNKSAHLFYMYFHFLFLKQCIIFYDHRDFIPV